MFHSNIFMPSNGTSTEQSKLRDAENSLEKIKCQLASGTGKNLLQGPLLKRSDTLRKWNERWVILDPTTGRMEYKIRRNEPSAKGLIVFDANSTIAISPVNIHGLPKYDGCCFYIGTPSKKDYFFCAETPSAARAWVSTLHTHVRVTEQETWLVLRAHKEAVSSLSGNGSGKLGAVAAAVAAANSTAAECSKEIEAAMQISMRNALGMIINSTTDGPLDDFSIMKETLRVKDEELQNLARDIRTRDATIKDIAEKLSETAEAAEAAATAAHTIDEQRRIACADIESLTKNYENQLELLRARLKESEEKEAALSRERDQLAKERDSALQEAKLWRSELAKARDHAVILEAAVVRAEEKVRVAEVDVGYRRKEAKEKERTTAKDKQELSAHVNVVDTQLQREQIDLKTESCSDNKDAYSLAKHIDYPREDADKACVSMSKQIHVPEDNAIHIPGNQDNTQTIRDGEWSDIQATEARIGDVKEVMPEKESSSVDLNFVSQHT